MRSAVRHKTPHVAQPVAQRGPQQDSANASTTVQRLQDLQALADQSAPLQRTWQKMDDGSDEGADCWVESDVAAVYDPANGDWYWDDDDEYPDLETADRARIPIIIALLDKMDDDEQALYFNFHPNHETLKGVKADIAHGALEASTGDVTAPTAPGAAGHYRIIGTRSETSDWQVIHLTPNESGQLIADGMQAYRALNRPFGAGLPFVSLDAGKSAAEPTGDFIDFLETVGFERSGPGRIQDRLHKAMIDVFEADKMGTLSSHLNKPQNAAWYTDNIRQGGLNELILTSQSTDAALRGHEDDSFDRHGVRNGERYSFVALQRDTSFPTKDFVFRDTYRLTGLPGQFQNAHVNARMYYIDDQQKKHKTVGPVSPEYHLATDKDSLRSLFDRSHSMKALVGRLIELHKTHLATQADITTVKADQRAKQVYELSGGDQLDLRNPDHLKVFARIVGNHTTTVLNALKTLHNELEDPADRPPSSPYKPPSPRAATPPLSPTGFHDM